MVLGYSVSAGTGQIVQGDCSKDGCDAKSELCLGHTGQKKRQCTFKVNRFRCNHRDMFRIRCRSVAGESPYGARLKRGEAIAEVKERYESEAEGQTR